MRFHQHVWVKLQHTRLPRCTLVRWFGIPKGTNSPPAQHSSSSSSSFMSLHFCGIWWSLRIMFPSRLYSSLNLICIFERKKRRKRSRLRSALEFTSSLIVRCFEHTQRWPQAFFLAPSCNVQLPSSDIVVAVIFLRSFHREIKKSRYIYSRKRLSLSLSRRLTSHGEWLQGTYGIWLRFCLNI